MMKKMQTLLITLMVVVFMVLPVSSGAKGPQVQVTGFPIVDESITLKGFGRLDPQHGPWDEMALWKDYEEKTNIHIEWDTPGMENATERKNLVLASGDFPDFFIKTVLTEADLIKYGSQGVLIPLEGYIEEYTPNLKKLLDEHPNWRAAITAPDGHIYGLPRFTTSMPGLVWRSPLLNMKWMERLGLDIPKTSDEFLEVLRAFRDQDANGNGDPKDEVPFSSHNFRWPLRAVAPMFGVRYNVGGFNDIYAIVVEDGKVRVQNTDPEYKGALQYYALMYQEGLVDQEIFTHSNKDYFAKLAAGRMGFTPLYQPRNAAQYANEYDAIVPPKGPQGEQGWDFLNPEVQLVNTLSITLSNPSPEATMRWADYFYTDEGATAVYMPRKEHYTVEADGSYKLTKEVLEAEIGMEKFLGADTIYPGGGALGYYTDKHMLPGMAGTPMVSYLEKTGPYLPEKVYRVPMLTVEEQERLEEIQGDLDVYVSEMIAKFVKGDISFDEWDKYVATMEKLGVRELEQILQNAMFR